jgi:hypothetical protein
VGGKPIGRFTLDILFGADKASKWGKELEDGEQGVAEVVVEGWLEVFGEAAREEMVTKWVNRVGSMGARGVVEVGSMGRCSLYEYSP